MRVLDPDPHCAASAVADEVIVGAFDDPVAAETLARKSAVVTYEIEQIGQAALAAATEASRSGLRPDWDSAMNRQPRRFWELR